MGLSEKVYRVMLHAYPHHYRRRYREPMGAVIPRPGRALASYGSGLDPFGTGAYWDRFRFGRPAGFLAKSAWRCVFFARFEASSFGKQEVTAEHLLLGVLREEPSLVREGAAGAVVRAIEASEGASRRVPSMGNVPLSVEAVRVISAATEFARAERRSVVTADLVSGILLEADLLAALLLTENLSGLNFPN